MKGIAKAKAAGIYRGRRPSIDPAKVRALRAEGVRPAEIGLAAPPSRAGRWRACSGRSGQAHRHDRTSGCYGWEAALIA
jgi:hypothetical protein